MTNLTLESTPVCFAGRATQSGDDRELNAIPSAAPMRIAINAISIRNGGPAVALEKLLGSFLQLRPDYEYHLILSHALDDLPAIRHKSVRCYYFNWAERHPLFTGLWYLFVLPIWLARKRIDVLFSQTCYLPIFGKVPRALLLQDAKFFSGAYPSMKWSLSERVTFALRKLWVRHSVRTADNLSVQTWALADSISNQVPNGNRGIEVIPHGPGYLDGVSPMSGRVPPDGAPLNLAYISLYRDYKNFDVLLRSAKVLQGMSIPVRLHLTLDEKDPAVRDLLARASGLGLKEYVVNHGELDRARLSKLYQSSHLFVYPSLCESFGFPQVEAMAFGLQVIAADTPVNREICGKAAVYFPPHDERALAYLIEHFHRNRGDLAHAADVSFARAAEFDWKLAASRTLRWLTKGRAVD